METVKYLCEFFFGNFTHWIGLLIICATIFPRSFITINRNDNATEKKD